MIENAILQTDVTLFRWRREVVWIRLFLFICLNDDVIYIIMSLSPREAKTAATRGALQREQKAGRAGKEQAAGTAKCGDKTLVQTVINGLWRFQGLLRVTVWWSEKRQSENLQQAQVTCNMDGALQAALIAITNLNK